MKEDELKQRTKQFSLRVNKLVEALPNTSTARTTGHQLLRSGMSVEVNYREACRGKSKADFIAKSGISPEEADEPVVIFTASFKTVRTNPK
jgi:four helix bundle protein